MPEVRRRGASFNIDEIAPRVPWSQLRREMGYRHDEHVTAVGPTGRGKTTLLLDVVSMRSNVCIIATKPRHKDKTLSAVVGRRGKPYLDTLTVPAPSVARRFCVWPAMEGLGSITSQRLTIGPVLDQVFREGNRAVMVDEMHYFAEFLRMAPTAKLFWTQGRSLGLSFVTGFQRPAWVPRDAYSQATHLFLWGTNDGEDVRAIGGLAGINSAEVRYAVQHLAADEANPHEFLYVSTRARKLYRSTYRK